MVCVEHVITIKYHRGLRLLHGCDVLIPFLLHVHSLTQLHFISKFTHKIKALKRKPSSLGAPPEVVGLPTAHDTTSPGAANVQHETQADQQYVTGILTTTYPP